MYLASEKLSPDSRIWIYQSSRELNQEEISFVEHASREFLESWTAHNQALNSGFEIRYNRFLILMVDEKSAGASGCSIDKSVHFIKSLESKFGVDFFDRMSFAYKVNDRVEVLHKNDFEKLYERGVINSDSIVFNNLVQTKQELATKWEIPVKMSWHQSLLGNISI